MSQTDSFIDEVAEEVRKDRLFGLMRRYGWIAILAVLLLVGGAAYREWSRAQDRAAAQALGDQVLAALSEEEQAARAEALGAIDAPNAASQAMIDLLTAAELTQNDPASAAERLLAVADDNEAGPVYRQIALLKVTSMPGSGLSMEERRTRLEGLALSTGLTRLLAEEQLALLELEAGDADAALARMNAIVEDAEASFGLQRRVSQVIIALGGTLPDETDGE